MLPSLRGAQRRGNLVTRHYTGLLRFARNDVSWTPPILENIGFVNSIKKFGHMQNKSTLPIA